MTPPDPDLIRRAIIDVSFYRNWRSDQTCDVIRGLLWTLTGEDPGRIGLVDEVLTAAGIPFRKFVDEEYNTHMVAIDPAWLESNGFRVDENDRQAWDEAGKAKGE